MHRRILIVPIFLLVTSQLFSQGFGIPSKRGGIGFGNLSRFTGIRFNFKDKNVERINGINVTVWSAKHEDNQTGTVNGIAIGLPMSMGAENQYGIGLGIGGVGATRNLAGINIAGLGVGAGESVSGFNFGGLGVGAGEDLTGINIGGLGAGAGGDVKGINIGGLGVGAGGDLVGFNFGGLGVGSGGKVAGINIGGLGVGAAEDITGISASIIGVGTGGRVRGITVAGVGIGAGEEVRGLAVAGIGIGSSRVTGITLAPVVGGQTVKGIMIAPAYFRVGDDNGRAIDGQEYDADLEGLMKGISVSAFNQIKGDQIGVAVGIVNYTKRIKGVQFGLINIVKENPKGLRVLPFFNTRFYKKG